MEVKYNVTGAKRKELAQAISKITGAKAEYQFMPTCAYVIDFFTLSKDGTLEFPDTSDTEIVENVLSGIAAAGFKCETAGEEPTGLTVSLPLDKVNVENLSRLLDAKGDLIKKALGIGSLPMEVTSGSVSFPWFTDLPDADSAGAYTDFISALCKMSRELKRVTATAKDVENEKYAFRCFLLRLGFIGDEYKTDRKILLKNLSGSSAFKGGAGNADAG